MPGEGKRRRERAERKRERVSGDGVCHNRQDLGNGIHFGHVQSADFPLFNKSCFKRQLGNYTRERVFELDDIVFKKKEEFCSALIRE